MPRNLYIFILSTMYFLIFNCLTYAQADSQQLPENLEEITLDNIEGIITLAIFPTTHVSDVAWSSDGRYLAAAAQDGIWVYDFKDKFIKSKFIKKENSYGKITFIPNSSHFISGTDIYDATTLKVVKPRPDNLYYISHKGNLYASYNTNAITISNFQTNKVILAVPISIQICEYGCGLLDLAFSPDDKYLAFSSLEEGTESGVIEVATGKKILFPMQLAWNMNYSPDSSMIGFSVARPGYGGREGVEIVDSVSGKKIGFVGVSGSNNSPIFSRDGQLLVVGGTNYDTPNLDNAYGTLYFFNMDEFQQEKDVPPEQAIHAEILDDWVNSVAFSPDYHLLATGTAYNYGPTGQVIVWGVPAK